MDEMLAMVPLTPDVSIKSPDLYKQKLFYSLGNNTLHGRAALDFVTANRHVSPEKINCDSTK